MKEHEITGAKAKELRIERGMTQKEFWVPVGVQQSVGARYESGARIPQPTRILIESTYMGGQKPVHAPRAKALTRAHQALDKAQAQINDARLALAAI
jgi:transcriptional regulator with XRE-family HTH domain